MKRQTDRFEKNVVREMLAVDQSLIRKLRTLTDRRRNEIERKGTSLSILERISREIRCNWRIRSERHFMNERRHQRGQRGFLFFFSDGPIIGSKAFSGPR